MADQETVFERWWPTTQSLDLIEGRFDRAAEAVEQQFRRVAHDADDVSTRARSLVDLDAAFGTVPFFDNVASRLLLLPTRSRWTVLWTNNFLCDGFDHFCRSLTVDDGLTTIHWNAHDSTTTFQPGATFHLRHHLDGELAERRVQASSTDGRWEFYESGEPLPEEDVQGYLAPRKRDRLNERRVMELLRRLDARPWDEAWYALSDGPAWTFERPTPPAAIRRRPDEVITGKKASEPRGTGS